jgi:aspartate carbamoyltransferase catalytic subunit
MSQLASQLQQFNPVEPVEVNRVLDGQFHRQDILSLDQFSAFDLHRLFVLAREMKQLVINHEPSSLLAGYLVSLLFFEPSSRTFGSFAAAVKRLGGQTLEIQNPETVSSVNKGESFEDTIRTFEAYSDAIVLRHWRPGSARIAADVASIPLINAGDGNNEHPTQTLLDLFTIYEHFGRLDHLTCLLAGDPLNSRVIHSMLRGLSLFPGNIVYLLSPEQLRLSRADLCHWQQRHTIHIEEISSERDIPEQCDLWYWTRIQKERFASQAEYEQAMRQGFVVTPELFHARAGRRTVLMDPLPRVATIDPAVDGDERALYFRSQIRNGLYIRMALLALVLGRV